MLSLISLALAGTLCNDGWWMKSEFFDACSSHNGIDSIWAERVKQDPYAEHCQGADQVEESSLHYIEENIPARGICFIGKQIVASMSYSALMPFSSEDLFIRNNIQQFFDNNFNWYFQPKTIAEFIPATQYLPSQERIQAFSKDNKYLYSLVKSEAYFLFYKVLNPLFYKESK